MAVKYCHRSANAGAESVLHALTIGLTNYRLYKTREQARQDIFEYIEVFYNRKRLHSTNGYWSPVDYEEMQQVM